MIWPAIGAASALPPGPACSSSTQTAETAVRTLGFRDFRVRHHGDAARIELPPAELPAAVAQARALADGVRAAGFDRVLLDVEGYRRGALNEGLVQLGTDASRLGPPAGSTAAAAGTAADATAAIEDMPPDVAGYEREIAVLAPDGDFSVLAQRAALLRQQGYRYAAVDLATLATTRATASASTPASTPAS